MRKKEKLALKRCKILISPARKMNCIDAGCGEATDKGVKFRGAVAWKDYMIERTSGMRDCVEAWVSRRLKAFNRFGLLGQRPFVEVEGSKPKKRKWSKEHKERK